MKKISSPEKTFLRDRFVSKEIKKFFYPTRESKKLIYEFAVSLLFLKRFQLSEKEIIITALDIIFPLNIHKH